MSQPQLRAREEVVDEFNEYDDTFKRRLKDLHWLMYFFEDGLPMVVRANYSGIQGNLAARALAKVIMIMMSCLLRAQSGKRPNVGEG